MGDEDAIHKKGFLPIIAVTLIGSVVSILERLDRDLKGDLRYMETSYCQTIMGTI